MKAFRDFLPHAGRDYASTRNYDYGVNRRDNVSMLSPWVRLRMLPEWTILGEILKQHSASAASKFIDEVCWRTYWKGWLQLRPFVWDDYMKELAETAHTHADDDVYLSTLKGDNGIECLDTWTCELIETGYLHNHARMWYASIWIHTLRLPWALGADFFIKHLLDGDAASNTLSWRWVAGLHTPGKSYLASAANIEKYTISRLSVNTPLATDPVEHPDFKGHPTTTDLKTKAAFPTEGRIGVIVHEEDLSAHDWLAVKCQSIGIAGLFPKTTYESSGISEKVINFREASMRSALAKNGRVFLSVDQVVRWARELKLDSVVMPEPPVGLWNTVLPQLKAELKAVGVEICLARHWWDAHFYPHAKAGFFRFKKAIPSALDQISQPELAR